VTLGDTKDSQSYELITSKQSLYERFMVHYNFLGFSVGEAKFSGAPGRRELGHGNLAKRALEPALDMEYDGTETNEQWQARTGYVPESQITEEVELDLNRLGWRPVPYNDNEL
jgi:hypothetical protein